MASCCNNTTGLTCTCSYLSSSKRTIHEFFCNELRLSFCLIHQTFVQAIDATRNHIIEEVGAKPEDPQKKDSKEEVSEKDSKKDSESKKEDSTEKSAEGGGKSNPDDDEQGSWSPLDLRNDQPRLAGIFVFSIHVCVRTKVNRM